MENSYLGLADVDWWFFSRFIQNSFIHDFEVSPEVLKIMFVEIDIFFHVSYVFLPVDWEYLL